MFSYTVTTTSPSLISLMVSVDVKHHVYLLHHHNIFCNKMGSDESNFNVSFIARDSHNTVSLSHNFQRERTAEAET